MLQLRTALFSDAEKFDPQAFAWTGRAIAKPTPASQDRPMDHVVNVLAAQMGRDGHFDIDALLKTYVEWTAPRPPEKAPADLKPEGEKEPES